jgi:hypothetical protein
VSVLRAVALAAAGSIAAAPAHADPDRSDDGASAGADDIVSRPLVLARDAVELRLTAAINTQPRRMASPLSLSPDAWWGVTERLTIGIIHSDASMDLVTSNGSFCVRTSELSTCDRLYHGGGVDVRYAALDGKLAVAPRLRAVIRDTDPFKPAITAGALVRWRHGRFAIASDPYLRLPLANAALGNRVAINLPVWFEVQPAAGWLIALRTGYDSDLVILDDGGHGTLAVDAVARVTDQLELGLEAGWGSLLGPQHDARHGTVAISAAWRN